MRLGGHTALMHDGRVTQFVPTAQIYRAPNSLTSARVFSDPPINAAKAVKEGGAMRLADGPGWELSGRAAALPDGPYTVAIRPDRVSPRQRTAGEVPIAGHVLVTELSGSESLAHFRSGGETWVALSHGVHPYEVGTDQTFYLDPAHFLYFAADGSVAA